MLFFRCCSTTVPVDSRCPKCGAPRGASSVWARFQFAGREYRKCLGGVTKTEALRLERAARAEVEGAGPASTSRHSLADLEEALLADVRRDVVRAERVEDYRGLLRPVARILGADVGADVLALTATAVRYMNARLDEGVGGQTVRRELGALARALRVSGYAVGGDWPNGVREKKLRRKDTEQSLAQRGHRVELEDLGPFWAALHAAGEHEAADLSQVALLTGLRSTELRRVRMEWVREAPAGYATPFVLDLPAHAAKTRRARTVGVSALCRALLARNAEGGGETVFSDRDYTRVYQRAARACGLEQSPHLRTMRHAFGTTGARDTGDVKATSAALGHGDVKTTALYLHAADEHAVAVAGAVDAALQSVSGS
jgi:integrase